MASAVLSGSRFLVRILDILAALIVARFLAPADFGIVALATAALGVTRAITELPVGEALIRLPKVTRSDIDTSFTLSILRGAVIALLLCLVAAPMASFYDDDRLIALVLALSLAPLAQGLRNPRLVEQARDVNFTPTTIIDSSAKVISFVAAVAYAFYTHSYWALVIALVLPAIIAAPASYLTVPYRPRLDLSRTRVILSYAGWVTLSRLIATANGEADRFLIGGVLGKAPVAFWAMGRSLAYTVGWSIGIPLLQAMFSGMALLQHDRERLVSAYLKGQAMIVALIFPLGIAVGVLAEPIVALALGPQWQPVTPIIQFLAPVASLSALAMPVQSTMLVLNRPKQLVVRDTMMFAVGIPALLLGAWWYGLMGAVYARTLTAFFDVYINLAMLRGAIGLSVGRQLLNAWRSGASAAAMALVMLGVMMLVPSREGIWDHVLVIAVAGTAGALAYVAAHAALWLLTGRPNGPEQTVYGALLRLASRFQRKVWAR